MPIPTGARRSLYEVGVFNEDAMVEARMTIDVPLGVMSPELADAAAAAAADAALAHLQAAQPTLTITARRLYDCYTLGDPWPAPAPEEA